MKMYEELQYGRETMYQLPASVLEQPLKEMLQERAWFVASNPKILKDHTIDNEFLVRIDELEYAEKKLRSLGYDQAADQAETLLVDLQDVLFIQVIDQ